MTGFWTNVAKLVPKLGKTLTKFESGSTNVFQIWPRFCPTWPGFGHFLPNLASIWPIVARTRHFWAAPSAWGGVVPGIVWPYFLQMSPPILFYTRAIFASVSRAGAPNLTTLPRHGRCVHGLAGAHHHDAPSALGEVISKALRARCCSTQHLWSACRCCCPAPTAIALRRD